MLSFLQHAGQYFVAPALDNTDEAHGGNGSLMGAEVHTQKFQKF